MSHGRVELSEVTIPSFEAITLSPLPHPRHGVLPAGASAGAGQGWHRAAETSEKGGERHLVQRGH